MPSSGMLRRVAVVRADVSEERIAFIRVTRICELGTTLAVTSNITFLHSMRRLLVTANVVPSSPILVTLMMEAPIFLPYVGSYKSHAASYPRRRHSS
jgi:hypothetical protein